MKFLQILVLILAFVTIGKPHKAIVSGTVYYAGNVKVKNAEIIAIGSNGKVFVTKTNFEGYYKLKLPKGFYKITFQHCSIEMETHNLNLEKGQKLRIEIKQETTIVDGCGMGVQNPIETSKPVIHKKIVKRKNNK